MNAVDLKERGLLTNKSVGDIASDIITVVIKEYAHYNDKQVFKIGKYGKFFPEVLSNPNKYIM